MREGRKKKSWNSPDQTTEVTFLCEKSSTEKEMGEIPGVSRHSGGRRKPAPHLCEDCFRNKETWNSPVSGDLLNQNRTTCISRCCSAQTSQWWPLREVFTPFTPCEVCVMLTGRNCGKHALVFQHVVEIYPTNTCVHFLPVNWW